jgi:hypothetical protein
MLMTSNLPLVRSQSDKVGIRVFSLLDSPTNPLKVEALLLLLFIFIFLNLVGNLGIQVKNVCYVHNFPCILTPISNGSDQIFTMN